MAGALSKGVVRKDTKQSTWGQQHAAFTAALQAHAIPTLSESIGFTQTRDDAPILRGRTSLTVGEVVGEDVAGPIATALTYNDLDLLFACALGFEHPEESPVAVDTKYAHVFEIDEKLHREGWLVSDGRLPSETWLAGDQKVRSFGFAMNKEVSDHAADSCMVTGMTLDLGVRNTSLSFDVVGWKKRNDDFSPDDWPSILGLKRAVFMHATVELGSVDGVLYPYSAFSVAALSLVLTNPMKVDDRGTATGKYIMEPVRNNFVDVGGRVTLPRYTSDDIVDRLRAETEMMLKIGFASGLYSVAFYVPRLVFTEEDISTPGPEVRQPQFSFKAYKPEPLTDITNPFKVPNGGTGEWYADLEGIPIVKNNPLVVMTVNDEDVNLLLEN